MFFNRLLSSETGGSELIIKMVLYSFICAGVFIVQEWIFNTKEARKRAYGSSSISHTGDFIPREPNAYQIRY